jgi:hypothetical protein
VRPSRVSTTDGTSPFPRACTLSGYRWTETAQARNARNQANWGVLKQVKRAKPGLLASGGLGPFAERILRALEARVSAKKRPMSRTVTGGEFRLYPHPCGPDRADSVEGMRGISTPPPDNPDCGQPRLRTIPTADNPDSGLANLGNAFMLTKPNFVDAKDDSHKGDPLRCLINEKPTLKHWINPKRETRFNPCGSAPARSR